MQDAFVRAFARFVHLRRPEAIARLLAPYSRVNLARKQFRRREGESVGAISSCRDFGERPAQAESLAAVLAQELDPHPFAGLEARVVHHAVVVANGDAPP